MKRIFYVDVGNLPKAKVETYMAEFMKKITDQGVFVANTTLFVPVRGNDDATRIESLPE